MYVHYDPIAHAPVTVRYLRTLSVDNYEGGRVPAEVRVLSKTEKDQHMPGCVWACEVRFTYKNTGTKISSLFLCFTYSHVCVEWVFGNATLNRFHQLTQLVIKEAVTLFPTEVLPSLALIKSLCAAWAENFSRINLPLYSNDEPVPCLPDLMIAEKGV